MLRVCEERVSTEMGTPRLHGETPIFTQEVLSTA